MAADLHTSKWRNFASWSVASGVVGVAIAVIASWLMQGMPPQALFRGPTDPRAVSALLLSMAVVGLSSRNTPFGWRALRNFVIMAAAASAVCVLAVSGFRAGVAGPLDASQWVAAGTGAVLLFVAIILVVMPAVARRGWTLMEADQVETLRERGRMLFLSALIIAAMGLILVLLTLAAPGGPVPPLAALAGLLVLLAAAIALSIAAWRMNDELDRTLSREAGMLSFYLILLLGGGWAMLAHLGLVPAPAPLDWVTMLVVVSFPASVIAVGRRGLFATL